MMSEHAEAQVTEPKSRLSGLSWLLNADYYPLYLFLLSVLSCLLFYLPAWLQDASVLFRYWDGPNYLYVARTLYDIPENHPFTPYKTTPAYFACHLPLYPLLIRLFSYLVGYPVAMLVVTVLSTGLATCLFYLLLRETQAVKSPFWSALVSLFVPARWLIYHSVGATEPLFLVLVFASMLAWVRGRPGWALLLAGLSCTTRIIGVLFCVAYFLLILHQRRWKLLPWLLITPIPLLLVFSFYAFQFGDFWAYFSWNSKLLHSTPMDILLSYAKNNQPQQAELYLMMYLVYGTGVLLLWRWPLFFWYALTLWCFNLFVFHEDLSRYFLPIAPLALVVAYDQILSSRAFKLIFPLVVCLAYLYAWPLVKHNLIVDWVWLQVLAALN